MKRSIDETLARHRLDAIAAPTNPPAGRWADRKVLSYAYAYEQATHARKPPAYLPTLP